MYNVRKRSENEVIEDLLFISKGSLSYSLCSEYFSQLKIDLEMYTYFAAVWKETK